MKNRKFITLGFVSAALALFALFSSTLLATDVANDKKEPKSEMSRLEALAKFSRVIDIVEQYNVDDVSIEELINKSLEGLLANIDAHSTYLKKDEYKSLREQTSGEFGGLGITVGIKDGALSVISPIDDTPAYRAGIKAGDIILRIDKKSTLNMTIDEAVSLMRGKAGDAIELTVVREGESKPLEIAMKRDIIKVESVHAKSIGEDIQYIRVANFDKKVVSEVSKAIKERKKTTKGIILDLRNNPGGLLDQSVGLVDLFVDEGDIVSQKGRKKSDEESYKAKASTTLTKVPLVVLINGGSASASEIVSGALQDLGRAVLVGQNTFGKGSVQMVLPVNDEEALKLTIARYYLPSGRTIQAVGVKPDIEVFPGEVKSQKNEYAIKEADLKKHLEEELQKVSKDEKKSEADPKKSIDDETIQKDMQLKSAIDVLKALIITQG
ncbi:MAG: S41 family peptidase [Sulfuricurvum sp.]